MPDAPVYNNAALGQGFSNLAAMFAPPSGADAAGYGQAALERQKAAIIQQALSDPNNPNFDRLNILLGNETGTNSIGAQDQNNATTQRGQGLNLKANEETALTTPVAQGSTRFVPKGLADMYDVPQTQLGNVAAQPNETIQTSTGQTVHGAYMPTQDQLNASVESGMIANKTLNQDELKAVIMGNTPVEAVAGANGVPENAYRPSSIGKQPVAVTGSLAQAFVTKQGGDLATDFQTLQTGAQSAQATQATIGQMRQLMADPSFYSGPLSQQVETAKRFAASLGLDPGAVSSMEQFNAMSNKLVVDGLNGSLGTGISNADRQFIGNTKPNLSNTPAGNSALLDIMGKMAQRQIDLAGVAREYANAHGGILDQNWQGYEQQWADQHPMFDPQGNNQPAGQSGGLAAPAAAGDYPEGTVISNGQQQLTMKGGQWVPST